MSIEPIRYSAASLMGAPGKTGLHGDWLLVARAIDNGARDIWSIAAVILRSPAEVERIVQQMGYLIVHASAGMTLEKRGEWRLRQAEANGR